MGKQRMVGKKSEISRKESTNVFKQSDSSKTIRKASSKRILMLQRRISSLINDKNSWEEKNKNLSDALKAEKLLSASLKKDLFHWQTLYHESAVSINTYKVKQFEMAQSLSVCLREIDSIYPHMVAFSSSVTSNKILITNILNSLSSSSSDYSFLTKRFQEGGVMNNEVKKIEKPTKHKVGPMVKGCHIVTKPKILLERLMLPQTQDQDQIMNVSDISPPGVDPLPSIPEEDEDHCFKHVSVRLKRSKLGTSWRQRRQEKLHKDVERDKKNPVAVPYNEDSSDSEGIPAVIPHMEEPVVRFKKGGASLPKYDPGHGKEGDRINHQSTARHLPVRHDDPLEGSSWMFSDSPSHINVRQSSLVRSNSSDDEDDILEQKKMPNLSSMNTLVMKNRSLNNSTISENMSKSESSSRNTLSGYLAEEPDSTNNVETLINNKPSIKNLKRFSSPSPAYSTTILTDCGTANNSAELLSTSKNVLSVRLSKVPTSTPNSSNNVSDRYSNAFCSPEQSNLSLGKRVRKAANHRYPSEDYIVPKSNNTVKSLPGNKSNKDIKYPKRRISCRSSSCEEEPTTGRVSNKECSKSVADSNVTKRKYSKSKTSVAKKSVCTPNTAAKNKDSGSEKRPSRRNKSNVCYKESPINAKKRRP